MMIKTKQNEDNIDKITTQKITGKWYIWLLWGFPQTPWDGDI